MIPEWLDIKPQYIDDNLDKFLGYLKSADQKDSDFYKMSVSLLQRRIGEIIQQIITNEIDSPQSLDWNFAMKLFVADILVSKMPSRVVMMALVNCLLHLHQERAAGVLKSLDHVPGLISLMSQLLACETIDRTAVQWSDISAEHSLDQLTYRLVKFTQVSGERKAIYGRNGFVSIEGNLCNLFSSHEDYMVRRQLKVSIFEPSCGISVWGKSASIDVDDIDKLAKWRDSFIQQLKPYHRSQDKYHIDEVLKVKVIDTNFTKNKIYVETIDDHYEKIHGEIIFEMSNILYYDKKYFVKYLPKGTVLTVQYLGDERFSLMNDFVQYNVERAQEVYREGSPVSAKYVTNSKNKQVWITEVGFHVYTNSDNEHVFNDYAILQIDDFGTGKFYGAVNAFFLEDETLTPEDYFDKEACMKSFIADFATRTVPVTPIKTNELASLPQDELLLLAHCLFIYQKTIKRASERYKILSLLLLLLSILERDDRKIIIFETNYLGILIDFAKNRGIGQYKLSTHEDIGSNLSIENKYILVDLLNQLGKETKGRSQFAIIEEKGKSSDPTICKVAKLVDLYNTIKNAIGADGEMTLKSIKRLITNTLSVDSSEFQTDLEEESIICLGKESDTIEFKTSFVYPPDNDMQPNEARQQYNVLKGICAFLNSDKGGTLYLGVNDSGYVYGIANDMQYLKQHSTDTYVRYVQDRIRQEWNEQISLCIQIELLYDDRVVAIHVSPYEYDVVKLEGKAYHRGYGESLGLDEDSEAYAQLKNKKKWADKSVIQNQIALETAIEKRRKATLYGYSSSSSMAVNDRMVEPYKLTEDKEYVICYDYKDDLCKTFKIKRIRNVKMLDEAWEHKKDHQSLLVDAFHMTGTKSFHIILSLDLMAKNLLVEEYPLTESYLSKTSRDGQEYTLDMEINSIYPIGRFYIGLVDHVRIIDSPELQQFTKEYLKKIESKV